MQEPGKEIQTSMNPDFAGPGEGHGMGLTFGKTLANMKFMGVAGMVYGILTCLSLVGALLGYLSSLHRTASWRRSKFCSSTATVIGRKIWLLLFTSWGAVFG